jgi:flagellar protein FlbD
MIQLTRLNNQPLAVNSDLIKFVERAPDTVLTLVTGEKVLVREAVEEVIRRIVDFRRSVLMHVMPFWERNSAGMPPVLKEESGSDEDEEK